MNFFDLHCDTALRLLETGQSLQTATGHVSLEKAASLHHWGQVFALFIHDDKQGGRLFTILFGTRFVSKAAVGVFGKNCSVPHGARFKKRFHAESICSHFIGGKRFCFGGKIGTLGGV